MGEVLLVGGGAAERAPGVSLLVSAAIAVSLCPEQLVLRLRFPRDFGGERNYLAVILLRQEDQPFAQLAATVAERSRAFHWTCLVVIKLGVSAAA